MNRQQFAQVLGFFGLCLLAMGAALYAINSLHTTVMRALLVVGATASLLYIILTFGVVLTFFRSRSARHGANMIIVVILVATIVVIVQALSARHTYRYDLTKNKRFSLAEQTTNILHSLSDDLELYGFYQQSDENRSRAEDLFDQYAYQTSRIRYEMIDPDRNPTRTSAMGITNYGTIVVQFGTRREQVSNPSEEALTNAILKVTREVEKVIYFAIGHGEKSLSDTEPDGYSIMKEAVENQNYQVRELSLFDEPSLPEDCQVLVVAGPTTDYFESETAKLSDYLSAGKNAVFLLDPQISFPNIEALLLRYRIVLDNNVVIDPYSRIFGTEYTVPVVTQYVDHPITRDIDVATFYPLARSVHIAPAEEDGVTVQYLAQAGKTAWGETDLEGVKKGQAVRDDDDFREPVSIAILSTRKYQSRRPAPGGPDESKIAVFGDSDFIDNSAFRISANGDFFLNTLNFLAEEKDLISIRAKTGLGDRLFLTASQGRFLFLVSVVLLPLSVMGFGVIVFIKRRRLG